MDSPKYSLTIILSWSYVGDQNNTYGLKAVVVLILTFSWELNSERLLLSWKMAILTNYTLYAASHIVWFFPLPFQLCFKMSQWKKHLLLQLSSFSFWIVFFVFTPGHVCKLKSVFYIVGEKTACRTNLGMPWMFIIRCLIMKDSIIFLFIVMHSIYVINFNQLLTCIAYSVSFLAFFKV